VRAWSAFLSNEKEHQVRELDFTQNRRHLRSRARWLGYAEMKFRREYFGLCKGMH